MNSTIANKDQLICRASEMTCPYNGVRVCMASFSSMVIDSYKREICCGTENYDSCPIFLSKVLRRS